MRHFTVTGIKTAAFIAANAIADQHRLRHQARAETAVRTRSTDSGVEIDLAEARIRTEARALRQRPRIGAAKLQRQRMLGRIEAQEPPPVACSTAPVVSISV